MAIKKVLKQIKEKSERAALQKLIDKYRLQEFNFSIENGHLYSLSIKFKGLKEIPKEIEEFVELHELNLSRNHIQKIEHLSSLYSLEKLILRENEIKKIENLDGLTHLKILDLSDNQIEKIEGLSSLHFLEVLELNRNNIKKIEGLSSCYNLQVLELGSNPIEKIEGLDSLTRLNVLLLSNTRIKKIEGLENLKHLKELYLAYNQITKIEGLDNNELLRILDLQSNKIMEIENLEHLTLLNVIKLQNNNLSPEDRPYVMRSAQEIVEYCRKKKEARKKNREFMEKIKFERDKYQIEEELNAATVIGSKQEVQDLRKKFISESLKAQKSHDSGLSDQEERKNLEKPREQDDLSLSQESESKKQKPHQHQNHSDKENPPLQSLSQHKSSPSIESLNGKESSKGEENLSLKSAEQPSPAQASQERKRYMTSLLERKSHPPQASSESKKPKPLPVPNPKIVPVKGKLFQTEQEWLEYANRLLEEEDYYNALLAYKNTLQLNTRNLQAWMNSGIAFNNRGDYKKAKRAFKQALAIDPNDPILWLYLGISYYNNGELDDAVKAFNHSLQLSPANEIALQYLSEIPEEYKKNIEHFEQQTSMLAERALDAEERLLKILLQYRKAYKELPYKELLRKAYYPPYITDVESLKHVLGDLILKNLISMKLYLDHLEFLEEEKEQKEERKIVKIDEFFEVKKLLAFTNLSQLWLAKELQSEEQYVLKHILFKGDFLYRKLNEQIALREIALLSKLKSPHIIPLINSFIGEYRGNLGYVLQLPYYPHGTLERRIKDTIDTFEQTKSLIPPQAILSIFIGLLEAILVVHNAGIIHRDIKPSNIIINNPNPIPSPKDIILIDFGIATSPTELNTGDFTIAGGCGTRGFSAPEQLQGDAIDFTADVYAIGATIYYAMTLTKYEEDHFVLPEYSYSYYQAIQFIFPILQKMLEKNPSKRYSSPDGLTRVKEELEKHLIST